MRSDAATPFGGARLPRLYFGNLARFGHASDIFSALSVRLKASLAK